MVEFAVKSYFVIKRRGLILPQSNNIYNLGGILNIIWNNSGSDFTIRCWGSIRLDSLSLSDDGNQAIVRFQAQSGVTYAIETTAFIQSNAWKEIARPTPTSAPDLLEISLDIIEPLHQFYRLKVIE